MDYLEKSIEFHDPNGNWADANLKLIFTEIDATRSDLIRTVSISYPSQYFQYYQKDEEKEVSYTVQGDSCEVLLNGSAVFSQDEEKDFKLNCERADLWKKYYTFLYGLPMNLKDDGVVVHPEVVTEEFNGEEYYSITVTFDENVGSDIYYIYFDKSDYSMQGYRFQHDLNNHAGEYITLHGLIEHNEMKIPKTRSWYRNLSDEYLATDELEGIESL